MKRVVVGLKSARMLEGKPGFIPTGRARGQKAFGVRYEKELAQALPEAKRGIWWEYEDRNGMGWCQTDFILIQTPESAPILTVLELKYTWTEEGHEELEKLYLPVVELALRRPAFGLVVSKNLVPGMKHVKIMRELGGVYGTHPGRWVWHWIPIGKRLKPRRAHSVLDPSFSFAHGALRA